MYIKDQFGKLNIPIRYIGRAECASPAAGSLKAHKLEQQRLLQAVFAVVEKAAVAGEVMV